MNWYIEVLAKYAVFTGRARRKEYWMFFFISLVVILALGFLEGLAGIAPESEASLLSGLYALVVLIPSVAVQVRRLHDTGRTGWWLLIGFVPLVGVLVLFALMVQEGEVGDNVYGANPKLMSV